MADRDLVAELRRVDDAFSQLKASRDDVVDALLAGDADVVIAQGNRRLRRARAKQALVALGGACALVATIFVVAPVAVDHRIVPAVAVRVTPPVAPKQVTTPTPSATSSTSTTTSAASTAAARPMPVVTSTGPQLWQPVSTSAPQTPAMVELSSTSVASLPAASSSPRRVSPRSLNVRVEGLAEAAPDVVTDDDVQTAVLSARSLAARGSFIAAAEVLGALLARGPGSRVADVVLAEQASLYARAGRSEQACSLWTTHRTRFAASDNSAAVVAALARHQCP